MGTGGWFFRESVRWKFPLGFRGKFPVGGLWDKYTGSILQIIPVVKVRGNAGNAVPGP